MSVDKLMSWNELKYIIETNQTDLFGRLPEDLKNYDEINNKIKQEYLQIDDYILNKVFQFPLSIDEVSGKKKVDRIHLNNNKRSVFCINDFPYAIEKGIEHHIIWSTYEMNENEIDEVIKFFRQGYETLNFINNMNKKSVKTVHHVHVLSKLLEI